MDYIIAGLGNPGSGYAYTRHNTGWLVLDNICSRLNIKTSRLKFKATCIDTVIEGKKVLLLRPQTFMNNSGESIRAAADFYNIPPENIIIICDDVALPCGRIRIRKNGSDGGHNGLKSIIVNLGSDSFIRIRIGVSEKPVAQMDLADWVLGSLSKKDIESISSRFDDIYSAVEYIISGDTEKAMALCNRRTND